MAWTKEYCEKRNGRRKPRTKQPDPKRNRNFCGIHICLLKMKIVATCLNMLCFLTWPQENTLTSLGSPASVETKKLWERASFLTNFNWCIYTSPWPIDTSLLAWFPLPLRAYPSGLGKSIHEIYVEELSRPARGDLRVDKTPNTEATDIQLFSNMEIGDHWPDADLLPVFEYIYKCKYTRTV